MEAGEWGDTNDSWIWDVDDLQYGEKKESGEWEWGDTDDSWIWDVDDLQYGGKKRKTDDEASTSNSFYTVNEVRQVKSKFLSNCLMTLRKE